MLQQAKYRNTSSAVLNTNGEVSRYTPKGKTSKFITEEQKHFCINTTGYLKKKKVKYHMANRPYGNIRDKKHLMKTVE